MSVGEWEVVLKQTTASETRESHHLSEAESGREAPLFASVSVLQMQRLKSLQADKTPRLFPLEVRRSDIELQLSRSFPRMNREAIGTVDRFPKDHGSGLPLTSDRPEETRVSILQLLWGTECQSTLQAICAGGTWPDSAWRHPQLPRSELKHDPPTRLESMLH